MPHSIVRRAPGRWALALTIVGSFVGCAEPTSPDRTSSPTTPSTANLATKPALSAHGVDAEFARLAKEIPGFGGMFYDRAGKLNVYMKPGPTGLRQAAPDVLGRLRTMGSSRMQSKLSQASAATTLEATYDFNELLTFKDRAHAAFAVKGVVYTDVDEASNRVRVAITKDASQAAVERVLANAGVPRSAVLFTRSSPISRTTTLLNRIRPVPGAAQIEFLAPDIDPRFVFICSIGFNARIPSRPDRQFFVTASHCSDIQGGNQQTGYNQPEVKSNPAVDRIATEFKDPHYGNPGGQCFEGFRCRFSDALLARYNTSTNVGFGKIARTTFMLNRLGSIEIDPQHPRWNIVTEFAFPFLGETAHKVGRSSGWTAGPVEATCVDVGVSGTDIAQLCQDIVQAGVRGGDSGSGVFERLGGSDIALTGILWGGGTDGSGATIFVFSPMENIEFELGQLTTSPPLQ